MSCFMQAFLHRMIQCAAAKVDKNVTEETVKVSLLIAFFSSVLYLMFHSSHVLFFCRCCFQILKIFLQFTKTSCPLWRTVYSQNLMHSMKLEPAFWIMYAIFFSAFFHIFFYFLPLLITIMISVRSHEA